MSRISTAEKVSLFLAIVSRQNGCLTRPMGGETIGRGRLRTGMRLFAWKCVVVEVLDVRVCDYFVHNLYVVDM